MRFVRRLSRRPLLCGIVLCAAALVAAMAATWQTGVPSPYVHDEFSYLLAADTFARGRLANPQHPMWPHFESMHIVHDPAYASMYPPAQGAALALGQALTGYAIVGAWLSAAAMAGAIYWMLRAWLPAKWALLGGAMVVAKYVILGRPTPDGVAGYWSQGYFGGAMAAIGGALLLGGLARIVRLRGGRRAAHAKAPCPGDATLTAIGIAILANSRPFEGLLLCVVAGLLLLVWWLRGRTAPVGVALKRVVTPIVIVLAINFAFMLHYNRTVTGSATTLPWKHHHEQYCTFPIFIWQQPDAMWKEFTADQCDEQDKWRHRELCEFHGGWEMDLWRKHRSADGLAKLTARKLRNQWAFFIAPTPRLGAPFDKHPDKDAGLVRGALVDASRGLTVFDLIAGGLLTLPLLALLCRLRDKRVLLALAACGLIVAGNLTTVATFPHYAAPMTALAVFLIVASLRCCRSGGGRAGKVLVAITLVVTAALFLIGFAPQTRDTHVDWQQNRVAMVERLEQQDGDHLVVVRYGDDHNPQFEWVFNAADIDGSRVVWAREMADNAALLDYFNDRHIWLLQVREKDTVFDLTPYSTP